LGLVGIVFSTIIFGRVFLPGGKNRSVLDLLARGLALGCLIPVFLFEAMRAAVKLAFMAVQPRLCFQPGVVRVPTTLENSAAITLLANLITLSPGTLTLDFSFEERCYYIHCIDVRGLDGEAGRRALIARFEEPLRRIFE
jgi:multicomponent Na+:H+ antiporter subunit E